MSTSPVKPFYSYATETVLTSGHEPEGRVTLNVGGERHEVLWRTLATLPDTRLGKLKRATAAEEIRSLCDAHSYVKNEFFFDRQPRAFHAILDLHRTGHLHLVESLCPIAFKEDLDYWGISESCLSPCCLPKYLCMKEEAEREIQVMAMIETNKEKLIVNERGFTRFKDIVWDLMEKPRSSTAAAILAVISLLITLTLIVTLVLVSLPSLQDVDIYGHYTEKKVFLIIEAICVALIAIEYCLRLVATPNKKEFLINGCNIIDLLIIIFSVIGFFASFHTSTERLHTVCRVVETCRVFAVFRILKLWPNSLDVKSILLTICSVGKELLTIVLILAAEVVIFGSTAYYAERDNVDTGFKSIVDGIWWAGITASTVGYGDMITQTVWGRLVSYLCCIGGLLALALLVAAVVRRYSEIYCRGLEGQKTDKRLAVVNRAKQHLDNAVCNGSHTYEPNKDQPSKA